MPPIGYRATGSLSAFAREMEEILGRFEGSMGHLTECSGWHIDWLLGWNATDCHPWMHERKKHNI